MSPEIVGLIGIIVMLALLCTGMWIGLAMGLVGFLGVIYIRGIDQALEMAGAVPYQNVAFYPMSVVPMFVLMGFIIAQTGIGADLYYTAHRLIGQFRGGLASATVFACAALAAIVGGTGNGVIVMSKVALPEMRRYGYDEGLSAGTIASASTMGILIPPSIGFIIYGILTEQPIGKLFMAGIIPGLLQALFYVATIYILCRIKPSMGPAGPRTSFKEKASSLKKTWAMIILFIIVMGGIYGGIFTPTEAGAFGAFGAIIISAATRRLTIKSLLHAFRETAVTVGMIMIMVIGTFMFMYFMAVSQLPQFVGEWVAGLGLPNWIVMTAIIAMYVILGGPLPEIPLVMLTIPILYPVVTTLGFNPIWFGVIIVRMLEIGSISPPVGQNIFLISGMSNISVQNIYRGVFPFIIADVFNVALLVAFPSLSLLLPGLMR